jgi:hypothetical protein
MNIEEFKNLGKTEQEEVLAEALELYDLVGKYPTSVEDIKIFVNWQMYIAQFGNDLENLLLGVYPYPELNNPTGKDILALSNRALDFVTFWNRCVKNQSV